MISIARSVNGVSINGSEYVINDNGDVLLFENENIARAFLHTHDYTDEDIVAEGIRFVELQDHDSDEKASYH